MGKLSKPRPRCLRCGGECKRQTTQFCSQACRIAHWNENGIHHGGKRRSLPDYECPYCHEMFQPVHNYDKFCSRECMGHYRWEAGERQWNTNGIERAKNMLPDQREKLAAAMVRRNKESPFPSFLGKGGIREDLGHYVRSRWEANICRLFLSFGIPYEYEQCCFTLNYEDERLAYTPDLKIDEKLFVEIKGWESEKAKRKRELMAILYPDIEILYIDEKEYRVLAREFRRIIPNWEEDKKHGI